MARRFYQLEKDWQSIVKSGGKPENHSEVMRKYDEYKRGKATITRKSVDTKGIAQVPIRPFGIGKYIAASLSKRALEWLDASTTPLTRVNLNWYASNDATKNASRTKGFQPAEVVVVKLNATARSETSDITGRKYKTKADESYTFPFGAKKVSTKWQVESEVQDIISNLLLNNNSDTANVQYAWGFNSENFSKLANPALEFGTTTGEKAQVPAEDKPD